MKILGETRCIFYTHSYAPLPTASFWLRTLRRTDYSVTHTLYFANVESKPLDPKENAQVLEKIDAMRLKMLASVNSTLHSITDYSSANPFASL
eukprot:COSAG02_NODE_1175_length_14063_cov_24.197794_3_plen_93_part_00